MDIDSQQQTWNLNEVLLITTNGIYIGIIPERAGACGMVEVALRGGGWSDGGGWLQGPAHSLESARREFSF